MNLFSSLSLSLSRLSLSLLSLSLRMRRQKKSFFAHHARLDALRRRRLWGRFEDDDGRRICEIKQFFDDKKKKRVFETKRGVIFEHTMMGITFD